MENVRNNIKTSFPEKQKIESNPSVAAYEKHRHVIIGPSNVGKTFYMLKILDKMGNKGPIHIITRSPNQYPNFKTSIETKPIEKYKRSVVIFDDLLGSRNSFKIEEFFTRGRHENLDVHYISQSYFSLQRKSIRNISHRILLFKQTLRDVQSMYYDIGAYDMIYDDFKQMVCKAWSGKFN